MSQKNQLSVIDDVSLSARRKFSTVKFNGFLLSPHFFVKERMVALEGEYGAWEQIEMTSD